MSREQRELRAMKMDMLRMRGELQRSEAALAVADLRAGSQRGRGLLNVIGGLGAGMVARSGWVGLAASLMRRPWAAAAGLAVVRTLKRHPVLAVTAVAAGAAAIGIGRHLRRRAEREQAPGEDVFSAPSG